MHIVFKSKIEKLILCIFTLNISLTFCSTTNIALGKVFEAGCRGYTNPKNAFDGNISTIAAGANDWEVGALAVDFGMPKDLLSIKITYSDKYAYQQFKVQVSEDGIIWKDFLRVWNSTYPTDERPLPAGLHRFLRVQSLMTTADKCQGECSSTYVSISEIEIFERGPSDPVGKKIIYPEPIQDRKNWICTSSVGSCQDAISSTNQGWFGTQWTTGVFVSWLPKKIVGPGDWVMVDMGSAQSFNQIQFTKDHEIFLSYDLYVSDDGLTWGNPILSANRSDWSAVNPPINFAPQKKRYFKLVNRWTRDAWWGLANICVMNTAGSSLIDTGDDVNIAMKKSTIGSGIDATTLFDGDTATGIEAGIVQVDLGAVYPLRRINVKIAPTTHGTFYFLIESSDDGKIWTERQNVYNDLSGNFVHTQRVLPNYSARYLRFNFELMPLGNTNGFLKYNEIEVFQSKTIDPNAVSIIPIRKGNTQKSSPFNIRQQGDYFSANGKFHKGHDKTPIP